MKILKRMAAAAMAGVLALTLLAGCAGGGGSATGVSSETIASNLGFDYSAEVEQAATKLADVNLSSQSLANAFTTSDAEFKVYGGSLLSSILKFFTNQECYYAISYEYADSSNKYVNQLDVVVAFTVNATEEQLLNVNSPAAKLINNVKEEIEDKYSDGATASVKSYLSVVPVSGETNKWLVVIDTQVIYTSPQPLSEID